MTTENTTEIENTAQTATDKDNLDANFQETADTAEAEKSKAAPDTGKFKSVEALMSAYLSLEAEFTRRSQRLKELEESKTVEASSPECLDSDKLIAAAMASSAVKEAVVGDYLKTISNGKSVPLIVGGVSCAAPQSSPKTIKEAGALARQYLKN